MEGEERIFWGMIFLPFRLCMTFLWWTIVCERNYFFDIKNHNDDSRKHLLDFFNPLQNGFSSFWYAEITFFGTLCKPSTPRWIRKVSKQNKMPMTYFKCTLHNKELSFELVNFKLFVTLAGYIYLQKIILKWSLNRARSQNIQDKAPYMPVLK